MAISNSIETRISLTGGDEVLRHFEQLGQAGESSGNQIRSMLIAATSGTTNFTAGANAAGASSGQLKFALQNLSFQANDVATSLASGIPPMRVFAQQGGQVVQAFQQGGGFGTVLRAAGAGIAALVTPMTAAIAAGVALVGGLALLATHAASAESATRQFDVILKGVGKSGLSSGKDLEDAAHRLRDVGLSASEARDAFTKFLREGGDPRLAEQVARIGANLNAVLGQGSLERFVSAAAKGGEPLQEFAKELGVIPKVAADTEKELEAAAKSADKFNAAVTEAVRKQSHELVGQKREETRQIEDMEREKKQQILDLTRTRGTAQQEIELQNKRERERLEITSARRVQDINREAADAVNELLRQRYKENTEQLAAYNKEVEAAAQKALDNGRGLLNQIEQAVSGLHTRSLTPFQQTTKALSKAWDDLLETMSKSDTITAIIRDLGEMVRSITAAIQWLDSLGEAIKKIPALPSFLGGPGEPVQARAAGGLVYGPGTATSDSVPIRASAGEYVSQTASVNYYGAGFYAALNRMAIPVEALRSAFRGFRSGGLVGASSPMPVLRFAGGGMVPAMAGGGARTPITLVLDGQQFGLEADDAAANRLLRTARKRALLSAGRPPS
jgi:hypothetical protein